eukprot:jgi/Orpsp1_1/1188393/evm.model.d7180000064436.1
MLSNNVSSISRVMEKDLNGGMICKSYFKPSDSKNNTINNDLTRRVGSSSGPINSRNNS